MMRITILTLLVFILMACQPKQNPKAQVQLPHPSMAVWKNYDFTDTTLVRCSEVTEKRFSTFLALLYRTKSEEWDVAVSQLMDTVYRASSVMFNHCKHPIKYTIKNITKAAIPIVGYAAFVIIVREFDIRPK